MFWGSLKQIQDKLMSWLVVWNMNFDDFPYIGNVTIPTDELHHFSEGLKPPTRYISINIQDYAIYAINPYYIYIFIFKQYPP